MNNDQLAIRQELAVARKALAEADSIPKISSIIDKAEIIRVAARKAKVGQEAQNDWAEFKLDAERRAGEMLSEMEKNKGGRPGKTGNTMLPVSILRELGIGKIQSSRWQLLAWLPEKRYKEYVEYCKKRSEEITEAELIRLANKLKAPPEFASVPPPKGKYRTIVIDPPWPVEKIVRDVRPNQSSSLDYPTMTIEEIKGLSIQDYAAEEGCHIYLWTTHRFLPSAFDVFRAWGVEYECLLTWVKNVGFTPFSWMYSTEHVLFGRIGSLEVLKKGMRLDFAANVTKHSQKPDVFYDLARAASPQPRLEMFAIAVHDGFKPWGNQVIAA